MSLIRLIYITVDPSEVTRAIEIWKKECAPLMIKQNGCISEKLLRSREAHEFISYSEWDSEADIATYTNSAAHEEIVKHTRGVKGGKASSSFTKQALRSRYIPRAGRGLGSCQRLRSQRTDAGGVRRASRRRVT
jgi:heme-degrading monooxygenase HmoA